jgi:hypothetical protein
MSVPSLFYWTTLISAVEQGRFEHDPPPERTSSDKRRIERNGGKRIGGHTNQAAFGASSGRDRYARWKLGDRFSETAAIEYH